MLMGVVEFNRGCLQHFTKTEHCLHSDPTRDRFRLAIVYLTIQAVCGFVEVCIAVHGGFRECAVYWMPFESATLYMRSPNVWRQTH